MRAFLLTSIIITTILAQNTIRDSRGNVVTGPNNVWDGNQNSIKGASNQVLGNQNQVTGNGNKIQGSGNVVGDISSEELAILQKQMAERLQGRFGNLFSFAPGNFLPVQPP
jgi:hypothetical protein